MADVLTNDLLAVLAETALGQEAGGWALELGLFVNAYTFSVTSTYADLVECTAPGYPAFPLVPTSWTGATTGGLAGYSYPTITFTFQGPGTPAQVIQGHFLRVVGGQVLPWGLTWATPFSIPAGGGIVQVNLTWQDQACP